MKKKFYLRYFLFAVLLFIGAQCSNTGNNRVGAVCRNQCITDQALCYLITTQGTNPAAYQSNGVCQLLFVGCVSGCESGTRYVSSNRTSSSRSSSGSGRSSSSGGGGSSGGGSSGGGSSGGGHGGGGH